MLTLVVRVPESGELAGVATLWDGLTAVLSDRAVAAVSSGTAGRRGNPPGDPLRPFGPPPHGTYALVGLAPTPADGAGEYGSHLLAFEPQSGRALEAESFGRLLLLAYAGPPGRDTRLRRTQGGLRFTRALMTAIVSRVGPDTEVALRVEPLTPAPWWAFWRRRTDNEQPLSGGIPRVMDAPLDEETLTAYVMQHGPRRPRRRRDPDTDTSWDRSTGGSAGPGGAGPVVPFEGRGGRFGGGGASGGWEAGQSRPSGVDDAGRILGTAAAGAAVGGLIEAGQGPPGEGAGPRPAGESGGDHASDTHLATNY